MALRGCSGFALAALFAACAASSPDSPAGASGPAGYDLDEDPTVVDEFAGKADEVVCASYPGGPLSGDDLLVLVNKQDGRQLSSGWQPLDLVGLPPSAMMPGRAGELRGPVVQALESMFAAAAAEAGLSLGVRSAYRSFRTQCITFDYKVQEHGLEHAKKFSAEPGRSQHQLGTTADITAANLGWKLEQTMGAEPAGQWLAANGWRFGFALSYPDGQEMVTGYAYEPWHWRYIGRDAALEMHDRGLILEEYLTACLNGEPTLGCPRESFPAPVPNDHFIGGPCQADADCAGIGAGASCLLGYPGGYCTLPCSSACPDRPGLTSPTFCVGDASSPSGLCHSKCAPSVYPGTGCRQGYQCVERTRPQSSISAKICVPS